MTDEEYASPATDRRTPRKARKSGAATEVELVKADGTFPFNVVAVTFQPGKRLDWHKEVGGQILIFTDGSGYVQERGAPKYLVRKGDIVKGAPGVEHWHGAAAEIGTTHIAITPVTGAATRWMQKVGDEEYGAAAAELPKRTD